MRVEVSYLGAPTGAREGRLDARAGRRIVDVAGAAVRLAVRAPKYLAATFWQVREQRRGSGE